MSVDIAVIERQFWPDGGNRDIWMIVDPARQHDIYFELVNSHLEMASLYSGTLPDALERVSPHLLQLEFEDKYTRKLISRAWSNAWGVFLRCPAGMQRLRRHLRTLLIVNDWSGRRLLFRYYDPRVLRAYLPTCTSDELSTVFGPIQQFWTEADRADCLLQFAVRAGRTVQAETDVSPS